MILKEIPTRVAMWAEARIVRVDLSTHGPVEPPSDHALLRGLEAPDARERTDDMLTLRGELRRAKA